MAYFGRISWQRASLFMSHLLVEALPVLEKVLGFTRSRYHLGREEGEDFASFVKLRLLERDCAILKSFKGKSSLGTFLSVVVSRLLIDYRRSRMGSRTAADIADHDLPAPAMPDPVALAEDRARALQIRTKLLRAVDGLGGDDQRLVRMHVLDGIPMSKIARELGVESKPLYRRLVRILDRLRRELHTSGIDAGAVRPLIGRPDLELGPESQIRPEIRGLDPSKEA